MQSGYKIVLLGEGRVGKTSLVSRYVNNVFDDNESSTIQASMYSATAVVLDGAVIEGGGPLSMNLNIWDTAGQERFHALAPIYYRGARGAILVYDVSNAETLSKVHVWVRELRMTVGERIQLVICGNKYDIAERDREVTPAQAHELAKELGGTHLFTSARNGANVQEAFTAIAGLIARDEMKPSSEGARGHRGALAGTCRNKKMRVVDEEGREVLCTSSSQIDFSTTTTGAETENSRLHFSPSKVPGRRQNQAGRPILLADTDAFIGASQRKTGHGGWCCSE